MVLTGQEATPKIEFPGLPGIFHTMLGSPSGSGVSTPRGLWPLGTVQAPTITTFSNDGFNKYGVYSLFPGGPSFGSTLYSHSSTSSTTGRFASGQYQHPTDNIFHTSYKVSDSLFSTTSYTFGAPTPPPCSPYSPLPMGQLELFNKGLNTGILQPIEGGLLQTTKKLQEKYCEKCCNFKTQICNCQASVEYKLTDPIQCCTRTTPIKWNEINLKKEPLSHQISEISTNSASMIKLEVMSPTQTSDILGNNILSLTEPSRSENTMTVNSTTMTSSQADSGLIQCIDKTTGIGTRHLEETSYLGSPAIWQYSAPVASVPVEPIVPVPVPPLVVRDPNTGGLLLVSANGLDSLQQTVVWPGYQQHSSLVLPSLPPVPSPSFQLLPSNGTHCFSGTSFHQQTQAHSTRLVAVTTDNKRKIPLQIPSTTLIKIETDQPKSLQTINTTPSSTATVITDMTPLITTHVIYQHPTNIIVSQNAASETAGTQTACKTQATSPVACLTPPPEIQAKEVKLSTVQDASNQTELVSSEENSAVVSDVPEKPLSPVNVPEVCAPMEKLVVEEQPQDTRETQAVEDLSKPKLALTAGLELLSNSIDQFESSRNRLENIPDKEEPKSGTLEGLNLLCALAEQRILEEKENPPVETDAFEKHRKEKRKSKKHSYDEPKRKKLKSDKHHYEKKKRKKMKLHKSKKECPCQGNYESLKILDQDQGIKVSDNPSLMVVNKDSTKESLAENKNEQDEHEFKEDKVLHSTPIKKIESKKYEPKKFNYLKKHFRSKSADFDRSIIASLNNNFLPLIKPAILTETPNVDFNDNMNKNDSDVSLEKLPSTQKRKVGRPKKLMPFSNEQVVTETIVAKKPKSNFIGYFFAAKEKFRLQSKDNPRENINRYSEESTSIKRKKTTDKDSFMGTLKTSKIKPKLKAEPTFKSLDDQDSAEEPDENEPHGHYSNAEPEKQKIVSDKLELESKSTPVKHKCVLTEELLEVDNLRVLTAMGGLFYAGQLNAVEPPDVYSIILDGERGKRPHIMSREEILRDAIVEVSPKNVGELFVGTRICAYWSQQYRCLYPGSIAEPNSTDSKVDDKFVLVEFDDGDSGRIALKDIRLLPSDYPVIEYDLNPLQSLMKRKKKPSKPKETSESTEAVHMPEPEPEPEPEFEQITEVNIPVERMETDNSNESDQPKHFKKKLLKRIKREKMIKEEKRKKKKHKCYDKKGKDHKHHKKHRKHRKHHNKDHINGVATNNMTITDNAPVTQKIDTSDEKVLLTGNADLAKENVKDESINTSIIEKTDDLVIASNDIPTKKKTSLRDRQESCESRSKMSAFLPARQLWGWAGKEYKRQRVRGRYKKFFYRSIQRGKEIITIGDAAVFLSTGRPDRPYIGKIEAMWELCGTMIVKVKWFYHPEETVGCPQNLQYPGALFESPHLDENDVQTISHKCDVVPYDEYRRRLGDNPDNYATIYDNNDIYYLAGYYDPTTCIMKMEPGIPFTKMN